MWGVEYNRGVGSKSLMLLTFLAQDGLRKIKLFVFGRALERTQLYLSIIT